MLLDTVRLAQPNRNAKALLAQKENSNLVFCSLYLTQRLFGFARRGPSEGGSMYLTCDRLSEGHNEAKAKRIKSNECFGLYGQATKRTWWMPRQ